MSVRRRLCFDHISVAAMSEQDGCPRQEPLHSAARYPWRPRVHRKGPPGVQLVFCNEGRISGGHCWTTNVADPAPVLYSLARGRRCIDCRRENAARRLGMSAECLEEMCASAWDHETNGEAFSAGCYPRDMPPIPLGGRILLLHSNPQLRATE